MSDEEDMPEQVKAILRASQALGCNCRAVVVEQTLTPGMSILYVGHDENCHLVKKAHAPLN